MLISKDGHALIGYLSKWGGLSRSGIRNLEERGILMGTREGDGSYRSFTNDDFLRLHMYQGYRNLEFTQAEALNLCSMDPAQALGEIVRHAEEVKAHYDSLLKQLDLAKRRAQEAAEAGSGMDASVDAEGAASVGTCATGTVDANADVGVTAGTCAANTASADAPSLSQAWRIERRPTFLGLPTPVCDDGAEPEGDESMGPDELAEVDIRWQNSACTEIGLLLRGGKEPNSRLILCELDGPVPLSPADMGPAVIIPGTDCLRFIDVCLSSEYASFQPQKASELAAQAGVHVNLEDGLGRVLHMQRVGADLRVTMEIWLPIVG